MNTTIPTEETFKKVFEGIFAGIQKETKDKYSDVIEELKKIDMNHFDLFFNYPLSNCIESFHNSRDGAFIYEYFRYVENAFTEFIVSHEGTCCSVDKSRYIVRKLYAYFEQNQPFSLVRDKDEEYWKTKCLTSDESIEFYEAIKSAFFGCHVKLVQFYLEKSRRDN